MAKSKKVNKWEAAPESIKKLKEAINGTADGMSIVGGLNAANDWEQNLIDILGKVLDDYNELEAKHNADCGLISKLEEENRGLKSKLDSVTRERNHAEHILTKLIEQLKIKNDVYVNLEVCVNDVYEIEDRRAADLQCDLDAAIYDLKKEEEYSRSLNKLNARKNAEMCNLKWERDETEKKIKILIDELKKQYDINVTFYQKPGIDMYGLKNFGVNIDCEENRKALNDLKEKIETLEKRNKELKDTLEKDREFGKNVGKRIVDSIREGCDKGVYMLHPLTRIDIHIEETNNMPTTFDRHAIPRISVIFNNTQTEMERDTAQHECETLEITNYDLKEKLEEEQKRHEKATRYISALTKALNNAGVDFHYVKIGDDGEVVFHIDSVIDKCAKRHYEEQCNNLRDIIHERTGIIRDLEFKICKLKKDNDVFNHRNGLLFKALDQAGIHPSFDNAADKWLIQYTDKAENAFLAADQIKRDAEKKIDKLVSTLDKCHMDARWDCRNDKWRIYVKPSDTEVTGVSFDLCEVIEGYEKLKKENDNLKQTLLNILETLETKVGLCRVHLLDSYEDRANLIAVEHDRLLIKYEKLKKKLNAIYGYRDTDNPCGICKNFDPKE